MLCRFYMLQFIWYKSQLSDIYSLNYFQNIPKDLAQWIPSFSWTQICTICREDFYHSIQWQLELLMTILRNWEALKDFLNCQRFRNVEQSLLSFVVFSFDLGKADAVLNSVIKTYQPESGEARICCNNKSRQRFNSVKQQRLTSVAHAYVSTVTYGRTFFIIF